jgi:hypothetical protein
MIHSSEVFQLVKSLSKSEKRYFKVFFSNIKADKKYIKLFDKIASQDVYNEINIKKEMDLGNNSNSFAVLKQYLYELIKKSLRAYHHTISKETEIQELMHDIAILFEKGLYVQCGKTIQKAKAIAERYEKYLELLGLVDWEIKLSKAHSYKGRTDEEVEALYKNIFDIKEKYTYEKEYERLTYRVYSKIYKTGPTRTKEEVEEYKSVSGDPLIQDDTFQQLAKEKKLSYQAIHNYYTSKTGKYFNVEKDFERASYFSGEAVKLAEANPHRIEERRESYILALNNYITLLSRLDNHSEMHAQIEKMKKVSVTSKLMKSRVFFVTNNTELAIFIHTGEFEKGLKSLDSIEDGILEYDLAKDAGFLLYYNMALIQFGVCNYKAAQKYLNNIINDNVVDLRSDLHCYARIISIIVHFELGNADLLEYIVRSTYRFLAKRERLHLLETSILNFIRQKMPKIHTQKEIMNAFVELKVELETIVSDEYEGRVLIEYFDFISWLESKIENRLFADVVKEKALGARF